MLYRRHKIMLALIEAFDGNVKAIPLQKYLFLFTRLQSDEERVYDFVPYQYGCFSFQANQDLASLAKQGYLEINAQNIRLIQEGRYSASLDLFEQKNIEVVKEKFGKMSQDELIRYTYANFPFYAIKSKIAKELMSEDELAKINAQKRHFDDPVLFTIGYEGLSLEQYIKKLILYDVHTLCDVRKNAYSQKYGFSKYTLEKACSGVDIRYIHVPQLGIESDKRQDLRSQKDYDILFDEYERTTLMENKEFLMKVRSIIDTDKRVALTCFEKDPKQCHRSRVANALMRLPNVNYQLKLL
ncbi:MAG: DUF488 domain-containing protein [Paludibacteraceae bacterium]|nr:DUF488 domain-containing protein [Paludibacteraceae bacterium]